MFVRMLAYLGRQQTNKQDKSPENAIKALERWAEVPHPLQVSCIRLYILFYDLIQWPSTLLSSLFSPGSPLLPPPPFKPTRPLLRNVAAQANSSLPTTISLANAKISTPASVRLALFLFTFCVADAYTARRRWPWPRLHLGPDPTLLR